MSPSDRELALARKLSLRVDGRRVVFHKRPYESTFHVLAKALGYALFRPLYPELRVEIPVRDRYRPDLIALEPGGEPLFWGECGGLSREKLRRLLRRYLRTHFAVFEPLKVFDQWAAFLQEGLRGLARQAPVELLGLPAQLECFFRLDGTVDPAAGNLARRCWPPAGGPSPVRGDSRTERGLSAGSPAPAPGVILNGLMATTSSWELYRGLWADRG